jgi:hypothetical protein
MHGEAKVEGQVVAEADIMCVISELNKQLDRAKIETSKQEQKFHA